MHANKHPYKYIPAYMHAYVLIHSNVQTYNILFTSIIFCHFFGRCADSLAALLSSPQKQMPVNKDPVFSALPAGPAVHGTPSMNALSSAEPSPFASSRTSMTTSSNHSRSHDSSDKGSSPTMEPELTVDRVENLQGSPCEKPLLLLNSFAEFWPL